MLYTVDILFVFWTRVHSHPPRMVTYPPNKVWPKRSACLALETPEQALGSHPAPDRKLKGKLKGAHGKLGRYHEDVMLLILQKSL